MVRIGKPSFVPSSETRFFQGQPHMAIQYHGDGLLTSGFYIPKLKGEVLKPQCLSFPLPSIFKIFISSNVEQKTKGKQADEVIRKQQL